MERLEEHPMERLATGAPDSSVQHDTCVTISDAARMTGASRTRLYRYVESGRIARNADGKLSLQSLVDAGFAIKDEQQYAAAPTDNLSYLLTQYTDVARQLNESLEDQIDTLREQLCFAQEQLRASQQREAQLWQMLPAGQAAAGVRQDAPKDEPSYQPQDVAAETHRFALDEEPAEGPAPAETLAAIAEPHGQPEPEPRGGQQGGFLKRWKS